ncbi:LysR family transcriptional regulator [Phreatobacter stygius]|uniref:LysR family transcriptional regulator n=1 Tax=Phreatobacter stygius TaxID=1940610 RepID=A0A4D7B027_9HYPH|nr:LysR family transcriptional regulator [Phreatobacter stygius]QCI66969.1 LysR family transcriptional regulator [Phreatobacter stygius]
MTLFDGMETFARVVEAGSFTAAARELDVTKSSVSETVRRLEQRLGVRLLDRSTRHVAPTEAGLAFHARARKAIAEAQGAVAEARALHEEPAGRLRIAAPEAFTQLLVPVLSGLMQDYPDLEVEIVGGVPPVDLVEAGFDLAVRLAPRPADTLIVRRVGTSRIIILGSPAYLARQGAPERPEDVVAHRCIGFSPVFWGHEWRFETVDGLLAVPVKPVLLTNVTEAMRAAALAGMGLTALPEWSVADELGSGALVRVLSGWKTPESGIFVVYPSNRLMAAKVKHFADRLRQHLKAAGLS